MRDDRASVLMLMPAAVMVMMVLGAFAVDATLVFLGEREVANLAAGLANDMAGAAVDQGTFYGGDDIALDPVQADRVQELTLATYTPQYLDAVRVEDVTVTGDVVTVRVSATVDYLFSGALPAAPDRVGVSAASTATARQDE